MSSSLTHTVVDPFDEDEFPDVPKAPAALLAALQRVPDPRKPRGLRHGLPVILSIAVCAVIAGARSFVAIAEWAAQASPAAVAKLGLSETVDVKVTLQDGKYHDVDSSEMAFKIAGTMVFKEAARKASPVLLEPVMAVEVTVPEEHMGTIIGDINSRRGQILGTDQRGNAQIVNAMVPLANMFGYVNNLRSMSQGRAQYTMHFDHYEQVPQAVAAEVRAKLA